MVDSVGRSGGLMLLWKEELNVKIINYSIDTLVGQ